MRNIGKSYLQMTIHKTKIISGAYINRIFTLKLKVYEQVILTEKISLILFDYNKSFFFYIPPDSQTVIIEISAYIKSFLNFDSEIGKLSLNINFFKLPDKNEWYSIKNNHDEMVLIILVSFSCDNISNREIMPVKKSSRNSNNISYNKIKMLINNSFSNKTKDDLKDKNNQNSSQYVNISLLDFNNISNISKVNTDVINSKKKQFSFGQSGRLSNIPNNRSKLSLFSINNHHHHNSIPTTEEIKKSNRDDFSEYISTLDSILEADDQTNNINFSHENYSVNKKMSNVIQEKLMAKSNFLKENKENLNLILEELLITKEILRKKESSNKKELDLYESKMKQLHEEKEKLYLDSQLLDSKIKRFRDTKGENNIIFNYDKEMFFSLNLLMNVINIDDKIHQINDIFSIINLKKYNDRKLVRHRTASEMEHNNNTESKNLNKCNDKMKIALINTIPYFNINNKLYIGKNKNSNRQKRKNHNTSIENTYDKLIVRSISINCDVSNFKSNDSPTSKINPKIHILKKKNNNINNDKKDKTTKVVSIELRLKKSNYFSELTEKAFKRKFIFVKNQKLIIRGKNINQNANILRSSLDNEVINENSYRNVRCNDIKVKIKK